MRADDGDAPGPVAQGDGRPRLVGRVGSLDAFWPLVEPLLAGLHPRRLCEIGVDEGIFTRRLLAWGREHGCTYVGIDPAPNPSAAGLINPPGRLVPGQSVDVLPTLEACEAYFIDGDHNYHTVRRELDLIARARPAAGPLVFAHDVGWPWARRDMYHAPDALPPEARHLSSNDLGVSLDGDELVPGGLCSPGRYVIAQHAGGERNGVLTAVEDFLRDGAAEGWRGLIVPMAYGLAVLYRPDTVPEQCRSVLEGLEAACRVLGPFLESCEANFLSLYLYAEAAKSQLAYWTGDGQPGQAAHERSQRDYQELQTVYGELSSAHGTLGEAYEGLSSAYRDLAAHSEKLLEDYRHLLDVYTVLESTSRRERDA